MTETLTGLLPLSPVTPGRPESGAEPPIRPGTFAALRIRNYRLFFAGQWCPTPAPGCSASPRTGWCCSLTGSPLAVGITTALQFLPMLLFGLYGGVLADRYPKRRLLLITQPRWACWPCCWPC